MSILVICGYEEPGCSLAQSALKLAGLPEAEPFRDGEFSARTLTKKICHAYKLNGSKRKGYAQVSPGKMWQTLSVDLMLANMETDSWGWAEPRNIYFLDYWRDFDPRVNFVLVYSSPQQVLARLMEKGPLEPAAVEAALADWRAYNEELLRFHHANPERSILVNAEVVADGPVDFLSACQERFDLDLRRINEPLELDGKVSAMALWSASSLFSGFDDVQSLFDELESVADLPRNMTAGSGHLAQQAWAEYSSLSKELAAALAHQETNVAALQEFEAQNRSLQQTIETLKAELDKAQRARQEQTASASKAEVEEARQENELLLLQLHQVQEELEHYFHKYQEAQSNGVRTPDAVSASSPAAHPAADDPAKASPATAKPVVIDMRHFIDGQNWHSAEDDGRWAGPGRQSTLRLPRLEKGRYRFDIDIVDAMAPEIVRNMRVSFNGSPIAVKRESMDTLTGALAPLRRVYHLHYKGRLLYPLRLSGVVDIDEDKSQGPLQIEFEFPDTISPASRGQNDSRSLAARLKQVSITPC